MQKIMKYTFTKFLLLVVTVFAVGSFMNPSKAFAVADPEATPLPAEYHQNTKIIFSTTEPANHVIKYTFTTNGTTPVSPGCRVTQPGTNYTGPIVIAVSTNFMAITCTSPSTFSNVVPFNYIISTTSGGGSGTSSPSDVPGGPTCEDETRFCPPEAPVTATVMTPLNAPVAANVLANGITSFTRDLSLGSTGDDVRTLQQFLMGRAGPAATVLRSVGATGYFGVLTQNAVIEFQKSTGITPAVGYVGAKTRARFNALAGVLPTGAVAGTPIPAVPTLAAPTA